MKKSVTILGDGQMGLVMADALALQGIPATIWGPFEADLDQLRSTRRSEARLPGFRLAEPVEVIADLNKALQRSTLVISAIPTQFLRSVWSKAASEAIENRPIVSVTKGLENGTHLRPSEVIADSIGESGTGRRSYCVLSGPTIAAELARRLPATMIAASEDRELARIVQDLFSVPWLRIYSHNDVIGVEVAGAVKNVIAIAAGMVDGLKIGANAKSALLARGLAELARLGAAMGARIDTFFGVAGVGDLATTCFSPEGRNRTCGERLARGESLESILKSSSSIVEGVPTTKAVIELARMHIVEMPIAEAVHGILFEGLAPKAAIDQLMSREPKAERIGT